MMDYSALDLLSDEEIADFKAVQEPDLYGDAVSGLESIPTDFATADFDAFQPAALLDIFGSFRRDIVAEGDSWFDFLPGTDLIDCLRRHHNLKIRTHARAGDTLERMIFGSGSLGGHASIGAVIRSTRHHQPRFLLFSGGGNDVAGAGFGSFLNHTASGLPPLRRANLDHMINVVFRQALVRFCDRIAAVSPATQIIMHGYGYSMPTGRGVRVLWCDFVGPWLKPALDQKGISVEVGAEIVRTIIDTYNDMLLSLEADVDRFHYVDLRPHLNAETDFVDELHPKNSAFARCADVIAAKMSAVS